MKVIPDSSLTVSPAAQLIVEQYANQHLAKLGLQNIKYCTWQAGEVYLTFFNMENGSLISESASGRELTKLGLSEYGGLLMTYKELGQVSEAERNATIEKERQAAWAMFDEARSHELATDPIEAEPLVTTYLQRMTEALADGCYDTNWASE